MPSGVQGGRSVKRRVVRFLGFGLYLFLATLIGLEIVFRLFPGVIPLQILKAFDDDLRREIAERRDMFTYEKLSFVPRDDGGPPLYVFLPNSQVPKGLFDNIGYAKTVMLDSRGYCNPAPIAEPPVDVVTLAGSHAWCHAVDSNETWTARLSQLAGVSTYNLATPGTGPYEYLQLLKQVGLALQPKVVFFNILEENDMRDMVRYWNYRRTHHIDEEFLGDQQAVLESRTSGGFLARSSYLYGFLRATIAARREDEARNDALPPWPGLPDQKSVNYRFVLKFGDVVVPFNQDNSNKGQPLHATALLRGLIDLDGYRPALEELVRLGRRDGFLPVVVYTPSAGAVYSEFIEYEDPALAPIMVESSNKQRQYLAVTTQELGLTFIDLTPALRAAAKVLKGDEVLYFVDSVHPSAAGHRVIADTIAARLPEIMARQGSRSP